MKCPMWWASTPGYPGLCTTISWQIQTIVAMMIILVLCNTILLNVLSSSCNSLHSGNICCMLQNKNEMIVRTVSTLRIKQLVVEYTGTLVKFRHTYNDFASLSSYNARFMLWLSFHFAFQTSHILEAILGTRRNSQDISASETLTPWLDQSLWILEASLSPFFPFLQNITTNDLKNQLPCRNNKCTIRMF